MVSTLEEKTRKRGCKCLPEDEELASWYIYDYGIGPIALAIIVFAPLLVVTQAKYEASKDGIEWRYIRSDGDVCLGNVTIHSNQDYARPSNISDNCEWFPLDTRVPGLNVDYTAIGTYISAFVLFFSAAFLIVLGPIGDFGRHRKPALACCVGIWCGCFLVPIALNGSSLYLVNGLLIFVGATAWNFGNRALRNAYLPLLVRTSPVLLAKMKEVGGSGSHLHDDTPYSAGPSDSELGAGRSSELEREGRMAVNKLSEQLGSQYSITTSAYFFAGQILGFAVQGTLVTLFAPKETEPADTFGLRVSLTFAALFGLVFCSRSVYGLGSRPGPPFVAGKFSWLTVGSKRVFDIMKLMREEMDQMMVFLIGRTLHWTAVQSILTTATLYIEREFSLRADELVLPLVVMLLTSMVSASALGVFVKKFENSIHKLTLTVCCITNFIPLYMLLGMREKWEIYFLFVLAGFLVSPFPALSRGILAQMIPVGFSSTIMSLEGILELGTSWIGPLVIGVIVDRTGSIRWGCFSMTLVMLPALPFLFKTNLDTAGDQKLKVETKESISKSPSQTDFETLQLVPQDL